MLLFSALLITAAAKRVLRYSQPQSQHIQSQYSVFLFSILLITAAAKAFVRYSQPPCQHIQSQRSVFLFSVFHVTAAANGVASLHVNIPRANALIWLLVWFITVDQICLAYCNLLRSHRGLGVSVKVTVQIPGHASPTKRNITKYSFGGFLSADYWQKL